MSTHDYNIANASGASVRSDINNALAAILSNNSNGSAPSTTVAYSIWADTSAGKLKIRNSANDAFVDLINLDGTIARDLTFTGASANIVFDQSDNALEFADNAKAIFGTGADLTISHDGANSIINDSGTGELQLQRAGNTIISFNDSGIIVTDPTGGATVEIQGFEGGNASLRLVADEGDDNGDIWRVQSNASTNNFLIQNNISGSMASLWEISTAGVVTQTGDLLIPSSRIGVGLTPNTSDVATNIGAGLIQTDGNIDIRYSGTNSDPAGARYLNLINTDTTLVADQPMGGINWIGNDSDSPNTVQCGITAINAGNGGADAHMIFDTAGTERFRIRRDGNSGIGASGNSTIRLLVQSAGNGSSNLVMRLNNSDATHLFSVREDGFLVTGDGTNSPYNITGSTGANVFIHANTKSLRRSTSSIRYKKDIANATWGLAEVLKLRPVTFKSNGTGDMADDQTYGGFTAEDVHDAGLTEFVQYNEKNEPDALSYGNMVALLTNAIKELSAKVTALEGS